MNNISTGTGLATVPQGTLEMMNRNLSIALSRIDQMEKEIARLNSVIDVDNLNVVDWIDKQSFVNLLMEKNLLQAARLTSSQKVGNPKRFLDRLMRELDLFSIHEGSTNPSNNKSAWRISDRKILFHRQRAVERVQMLIKYGRDTFKKID